MARSQNIFGIDVSRHQGDIDWARVRNAGVKFAFIKASEGVSWVDPEFAVNWSEAKKNGIIRGAYHFFRPRADVDRQIDNLVNTVGKLESGDLPPVLDLEVPDSWQRFSKQKRLEMVLKWLDGVEKGLGVRPIIYLSPSFADDTLGNPAELAGYDLWIAHYTSKSSPRVPAPWSDWTFWQYSETGKVDGISSEGVDLDRYTGSLRSLKRLAV
ncbi:MAG: glycoside hydrolase family 25 protein [Cyanobacteria bacterium HKST-UBA02]|nr:glycoside hydrolase family 25 protein [Cyanobacteria bacterium HKST-UBA02]